MPSPNMQFPHHVFVHLLFTGCSSYCIIFTINTILINRWQHHAEITTMFLSSYTIWQYWNITGVTTRWQHFTLCYAWLHIHDVASIWCHIISLECSKLDMWLQRNFALKTWADCIYFRCYNKWKIKLDTF